MQTPGHLELNPKDPLPFASGCASTARAAWRLARPVFWAAAAPYVVAYSVLMLAESASRVAGGSGLPAPLTRAYLGFAGSLCFALSTTIMLTRLLGNANPIGASVALLVSRARQVRPCALLAGTAFVIASPVSPAIENALPFVALGPPFVIHAVLFESSTTKEALARAWRFPRSLEFEVGFDSFLVGAGVLAAWAAAQRVTGWVVERLSNDEALPGSLIAEGAAHLVSAVTLTCMAAVWLVTYLNHRSLSEGVGIRALSAQWRFLSRQRECA